MSSYMNVLLISGCLCGCFVFQMISQNGGTIINMSSVASSIKGNLIFTDLHLHLTN